MPTSLISTFVAARQHTVRAEDALEHSLQAIESYEADVQAFVHLDVDRARAEARAIDARSSGPLSGMSFGVKDIFDTFDQPTGYGSPIYAGSRPASDAGVVAMLRAAGLLCIGKTVTTEFAMATPGPTRNPFLLSHTPGGSSQGSAAGVALGMFDVALGTQTAGSVIRPASFCGVYGYKPTKGTISTAGVKPVSQSLDTVGFFARSVEHLDALRSVLTNRPAMAPSSLPWKIALYETDQWPELDADGAAAIARGLAAATDAGAIVSERPSYAPLHGLTARCRAVTAYEAWRSLAYEYNEHRSLLSPSVIETLELGASIDPSIRDGVLEDAKRAGNDLDAIFGDADVLLTAPAKGEAPEGLSSTGDARFCTLWTLLGYPAVSVPGQFGPNGLPIGIQLIGRPGRDDVVLAAARWLGEVLSR